MFSQVLVRSSADPMAYIERGQLYCYTRTRHNTIIGGGGGGIIAQPKIQPMHEYEDYICEMLLSDDVRAECVTEKTHNTSQFVIVTQWTCQG